MVLKTKKFFLQHKPVLQSTTLVLTVRSVNIHLRHFSQSKKKKKNTVSGVESSQFALKTAQVRLLSCVYIYIVELWFTADSWRFGGRGSINYRPPPPSPPLLNKKTIMRSVGNWWADYDGLHSVISNSNGPNYFLQH